MIAAATLDGLIASALHDRVAGFLGRASLKRVLDLHIVFLAETSRKKPIDGGIFEVAGTGFAAREPMRFKHPRAERFG